MSTTIKKQSYLSAKAIGNSNYDVNEDNNYYVDEEGISLPWRLHFFNYPIKLSSNKYHVTNNFQILQ